MEITFKNIRLLYPNSFSTWHDLAFIRYGVYGREHSLKWFELSVGNNYTPRTPLEILFCLN